MPSYKDLFEVHLKYIDYILAKTLLSNQFLKNISTSGADVEIGIREILRSVLPKRFHVTHGYIVSAKDATCDPKVSRQIDIIIVDTLVEHSIFRVDDHSGMEVVPIESVLGIFEVKRTLNKESILKSIEHLEQIILQLNIGKNNPLKVFPGGYNFNFEGQSQNIDPHKSPGYFTNPIVGILSLDYDGDIKGDLSWIETPRPCFIDIFASFNGYACLPLDLRQKVYKFATYLDHRDQLCYVDIYPSKKLANDVMMTTSGVCAAILGYISAYLQNVCGTHSNPQAYFFNKTLLTSSK